MHFGRQPDPPGGRLSHLARRARDDFAHAGCRDDEPKAREQAGAVAYLGQERRPDVAGPGEVRAIGGREDLNGAPAVERSGVVGVRDAPDVLQQGRVEHGSNGVVPGIEATSEPATDEAGAGGMAGLQPSTEVPDGREPDERIRDPELHEGIVAVQRLGGRVSEIPSPASVIGDMRVGRWCPPGVVEICSALGPGRPGPWQEPDDNRSGCGAHASPSIPGRG